MKHKHYLEIAGMVASNCDYHRCPTGCVVVYKKSVISFGWNSTRTSPMQAKYNLLTKDWDASGGNSCHKLHAEISALAPIRLFPADWGKVRVYIARLLSDGTTGYSRPCPACMKAIKEMGIKRVYYTTGNGFAEEKIWM